jgi:hypothetical protein
MLMPMPMPINAVITLCEARRPTTPRLAMSLSVSILAYPGRNSRITHVWCSSRVESTGEHNERKYCHVQYVPYKEEVASYSAGLIHRIRLGADLGKMNDQYANITPSNCIRGRGFPRHFASPVVTAPQQLLNPIFTPQQI